VALFDGRGGSPIRTHETDASVVSAAIKCQAEAIHIGPDPTRSGPFCEPLTLGKRWSVSSIDEGGGKRRGEGMGR
jgi:hypothetical protein